MQDVILVHGAWHGGWCWDETVVALQERGLGVTVIDQLPSASGDPDLGVAADGEVLRELLDDLDRQVVVVGHSQGGMTLSETAGHPHIGHAVYIAAFVPTRGASVVDILEGPTPDWFAVDPSGKNTFVLPEHAVRVLASNAPTPERARQHVRRLGPLSVLSLTEPSTTRGWGSTPVTYVLTERDEAVSPKLQEAMARTLGVEPIRIDSPHIPMYSHLPTLVRVIADAAAQK